MASAEEALLLGRCIYFPKEIARVQLQKDTKGIISVRNSP